MYKKAVDKTGLGKDTQANINYSNEEEKKNITGVAGDKLVEPGPLYISTPSEVIYQNDNGSFIVLGRDRNAGRLSGYGGKGDTQCASIDLVVGRMASSPRSVDEDGNPIYTDPNFKLDSARIYISQKSDIDEYFGLTKGSVGNSKTKSGIGLKADKVVVTAREGVKIVSGLDKFNSQGAPKRAKYGIDLIANNDSRDMQPLVKGKNLQKFLIELLEHIDELNGTIETLYRNQITINSALLAHTHPVAGVVATPSIELAAISTGPLIDMEASGYVSVMTNKINSTILKYNFLTAVGSKYINSRHNKTN